MVSVKNIPSLLLDIILSYQLFVFMTLVISQINVEGCHTKDIPYALHRDSKLKISISSRLSTT